MSLALHRQNDTEYFQKGSRPNLLLMSGTHGDEFEVIGPLKRVIEKYRTRLPDLVFIPEVSPSAIRMGTRRNRLGNDTNRKFYQDTDDSEARAVMDIVSQFSFDLGISFHMDILMDSFYLYDSSKLDPIILNNLEKSIAQTGVALYSGIDDTEDVTLGNVINQGYISIPGKSAKVIDGDFWDWSLSNGYVKRLLYPEIPGKIPADKKSALADLLFTDLIFPLLKI